jgi:ATP-dependent DNA ligase
MPRRTIAGDLPAPMLAKLQDEIPRGDDWTYEPKWDGFRTIVAVGDGVRLASRDGRPLGRYFPEIEELVAERPPADGYVADGEILVIRPSGMEFDQLQLRLHPAESRVRKLSGEIPATLVLFDLLQADGEDLAKLPLRERRERLAILAKAIGAEPTPDDLNAIPPGPDLLIAPWTDDLALAESWFADEAGVGQDGIVAKLAGQPYLSGERGWVKVKHRTSADCVVGGYRVAKDGVGVGSLLLGLYDDEGNLHYVGHTSSFKAAERRQLRELLAPLERGDHGFGGRTWEGFEGVRAPGGQSRWSAGKDTEWVDLEPSLVCEVSFDRVQYGRFRHAARFLRWRPDRKPETCTWAQLGIEPPRWGEPG